MLRRSELSRADTSAVIARARLANTLSGRSYFEFARRALGARAHTVYTLSARSDRR